MGFFEKSNEITKKEQIYILLLENKKFYIGFTTRDINERVSEHKCGEGALWTKLHKPKKLIYYDSGNEKDENELTLQMMKEFGFYNVRGGEYVMKNLVYIPEIILENKFEINILNGIKKIIKEVKNRLQIVFINN